MEGGGTPYSSSMAPSGSYILVIVSQPVTEQHKEMILERLNKGLLSWDVATTGCDLSGLEAVCSKIDAKHLNETDVLIQHSTESLGVEVLVSPTVSTLKQCVKNLFSTATAHKHLIHTGYTFAGSGSWILQNGTFSFDEFLEIFQQAGVQRQKRCNIHVHCAEVGSWSSATKDVFNEATNVMFNPPEKVNHVPGSEHLISCLTKVLSPQALEEIMEASSLVGNIRFNRPTLYVFPAGQGDCALFGINGFNMLIDGGFNRKPCSWEFIRHLDRLDAVLVTRLCENNVCGMSTLMKRKSFNNTYPQIGYVFCNIAENNIASPKANALKHDDLIISVVSEGHRFTQTLNELKLKPHQCWRDSSVEPFVLYHKVGHGTLEMHVLSPPKDSKEMKDFLSEWSSYKETFSSMKSGVKSTNLKGAIPLSHSTSICAVLIWRPADPKDTITRILFPGSAPQSKIFESLDKLKNLDVLKQPTVTKASLSLVTKSISTKIEKSATRASVPNRKNTASPALSVSSAASRNGDIDGIKKETKKVVKEVKKDNKDIKKEVKKEVKKDSVVKEVKKTLPAPKKEVAVKKESVLKETKKDIKPITKKETKDLKSAVDKKSEIKTASKKIESSSTNKSAEVKKTATSTVRKSTPGVKKESAKPTTVPKTAEVRKSAPAKLSEPKAAKEVSNKKTAEVKSVPKTKVKTSAASAKPSAKPAPSKPGNKVTKAVAASSIVASAVAVTVAAFELNEKKEEIVDNEVENIAEKEAEIMDEMKDAVNADKSEEINVSPLPPEALSPTPSESISLTPSDTLSSAPLETVSPTPPLANDPMSIEEKEVNEIKEIEQDPIPYETETAEETQEAQDMDDAAEEINEIELELARRQQHDDVMSASFIGGQIFEEQKVEEIITKSVAEPEQYSENNVENFIPDDTNIDQNIEHVEKQVEEMEHTEFDKKIESYGDDQLAGLSMEGSFCVGMTSSNLDNLVAAESAHFESSGLDETTDINEPKVGSFALTVPTANDYKEVPEPQHETELHQEIEETQKFENSTPLQDDSEDHYDNEPSDIHEGITQQNIISDDVQHDYLQNNEYEDGDNKYETEVQEKDIADNHSFAPNIPSEDEFLLNKEGPSDDQHVQDWRSVHSLDRRILNAEDYDISQNIIDDAEMQETSVDEPEEVVRKESAVSITLNGEEQEVLYDDDVRRKSCTESEDEVDIQNYMINDRKDSFSQDRLGVRNDSDSDNEDVVKSPTPHAIVDYEGQVDENINDAETFCPSEERTAAVEDQKTNMAYLSEKQDFNEKDRDSTEDQEDMDDGEMIRHPTPPEMKYSEEEMRDPIGQHYITGPPQGTGITEQPLYEEDECSDRSVSPVVEQPVFGSVVAADFPELVTVSGGTTPSEPQSPKNAFDSKKFASETAVMDALSEHDCSEGSTHSPLYHDGAVAFELPVSEEAFQNEGIQDISLKHDGAVCDQDFTTNVSQDRSIAKDETSHLNELLDNKAQIDKVEKIHDDNYDAPSDDESYSQNDKSETRSEKSDGGDDTSDIHHDDKSDHHHDGKSDIMDDDQIERRSDIYEDDRSDSHFDDKQDGHGGKETGNYDIHEDTRSHAFENDQFLRSETDKPVEEQDVCEDLKANAEFEHSRAFENYEMQSEPSNINDFKSFSENPPDKVQSHIPGDFESEIPDGFGSSEPVDSHYQGAPVESKLCDESYIPITVEDKTGLSTDEIPENFNIPTGFQDEQAYVYDRNSPDVPLEEHINPSREGAVHSEATDFKQFHLSDVPTGYDSYEPIHTEQEAYGLNIQTVAAEVERSYFHQETEEMSNHEEDVAFSEQITNFQPSSADIHEDISPQTSENLSGFENKILTEEIEAHQYETLSKFEENTHTSNISYTENSLVTNVISGEVESQISKDVTDSEDSNFNIVSKENEFSTSQKYFEEATDFQPMPTSYDQHIETTYLQEPSAEQETQKETTYSDQQNYAYESGLGFSEGTHELHYSEYDSSNLDQFSHERYAPQSTASILEPTIGHNLASDSTAVADIGSLEGKSEFSSEAETAFAKLNGDQPAWIDPIGGHTTQHMTETNSFASESHVGYTTNIEQESSYIISSRFHSDSPEDNAMRSDSSPEAPPSDFQNPMSSAVNQTKDEYPNINLPIVRSGSPNNANRDNPYGESSEDEDSSSIPGTVSPYAYTNKAYTKEAEDVDGNHIYNTTEKTETLKEFDGNNPQNITTHQMGYTQGYQESEYIGETNRDFRLEDWGKPMGLPTPPDGAQKTTVKKTDKPSAKVGKTPSDTNGKAHSPAVASKMSSPLKKAKPKTTKESSCSPVYVDLAYVPHHGDPQYCDVEFFKKIRARYYVFSGINPSKEVLNALLEAKKSWKEEDLEVTIIPTYETDTLGYWMAQNQDDLAAYSIEVAPSASRCTVNLQDHETSCAAYRLEF